MLVKFSVVFSAVSLLISTVSASGQIIQIVDSTNFCTFLPPSSETDRVISDTEYNANAFCMGSTPKATGAEKIPTGFIQSAHYVKTDNYVQITGQIDPSKANLISTDDGGQYDIRAPMGASCVDWDYFINLIEPSGRDYCIRCCNNPTDCNRGISEKGCGRLVPGDYSGPNGSSPSDAVSSTSAAASSSASAATSSSATSSSEASSSVTSSSTVPSSSASVSSAAVSSAVQSIVSSASVVVSASSSAPASSGSVKDQSINAAGLAEPMYLVTLAGALLSSALFL
ncbi:hypothetical protein BY458DRAFT_501322 [Sporodiniella umbellata]|nr:hypothetical protein BY458DRAFT_501322 [Sporodiniella umbellata]